MSLCSVIGSKPFLSINLFAFLPLPSNKVKLNFGVAGVVGSISSISVLEDINPVLDFLTLLECV
jgi:hypothetical protein